MSKILCVDIGGTRIKAAVLPPEASHRDAQGAQLVMVPTLGWLNDSLPRLLTPENVSAILQRGPVEPEYDAIRVAVPGPVTEGRYFERQDLWAQGVPRHLKGAFEKHSDPLSVWLLNDADAWAVGIVRSPELFQTPLEYPSLALTLGTGVGISVASSPSEIVSLEVAASPSITWDRLTATAGPTIHDSCQVHQILGREFFEWVAGQKKRWSAERIRQEFTKRVIAFVLDARDSLYEGLGEDFGAFKSLVVGGGNAEHVSLRDLKRETAHDVRVLARSALLVVPEVIPLLGLSHCQTRVAITKGPW
ncbi:MAG: hypothetical protein ACYS15_18885 [Planctomycetota bacterium]